MTFPTIVPFYAGLFAILFFVLSVRTIRARQAAKVAVGHGNDPVLERRHRVHANFAEYVPFILLLLTYVELQPRPAWFVHALCIVLLAGRLAHGYGVSQQKENFRFRMIGVLCTMSVMLIAAISSLYSGLATFFAAPPPVTF